MASSRKRPSAKDVAVALSGGIDSTVLLHLLSRKKDFSVEAIHVHHGLSPNADAWAAFCRRLCKRLGVRLSIQKIRVKKQGKGLEAAAREARYAAFAKAEADCIALAHNLDDQAETVLMNLLRGAGARGASGMAERSRRGGKIYWRPLLGMPRKAIEAYARKHKLAWIEDESNADESLTRNFIRHGIGPLLEKRFPKWKEALARAARHLSRREIGRQELLREFLRSKGLQAPSEAKLLEMLKQLGAGGARTSIAHDGKVLRVYRDKIFVSAKRDQPAFAPIRWKGETRLEIPALGGELRFRPARGRGIAFELLKKNRFTIRLRRGGERLQPDPRRPRRTLKNLFQEAGVPPWERDRLPLLVRGDELVWAPGLGVDARYRAAEKSAGWLPEWRKISG